MTSLKASTFLETVATLANLNGECYLQAITDILEDVTKQETVSTPVSLTPEWKQFTERWGEKMNGRHILGHAAELDDPLILDLLDKHTQTFEAHIATYFNGQEPTHYSVTGPIMAGSQFGVGKNFTTHPTKVSKYDLDSVLVGHLRLICPQLKKADIGDYRKPALEGYHKPFNVRYILKVNAFKRQKRAVLVGQDDAELVRRHSDGDFAFQVLPNAKLLETSFHNTIVVTYWVYIPLMSTSQEVKWTFGTAYVSDTFPHSKPSLINQLNGVLNEQTNPDELKKLINKDKDKTVYALLPPHYDSEKKVKLDEYDGDDDL